jgi:hypothetical protein
LDIPGGRKEGPHVAPSAELFNLSASTPDGSFVRGNALLRGEASGVASFRRGFRLGAEAGFAALTDVDVGDELKATLRAGLSARAGIAVEAGLPLDLFSEAGVVARFRAQAEAAGTVNLAVSLEMDELKKLVAERQAIPAPELLDIFFEEFVMGAGMWGRASFSAQILGEAVLAGSLLPSATGGPGFSASAEWAAGWGFGKGMEFVANFGLEDPRRFVDRLSGAISARTLAEAERYVATLPSAQADAVKPALAMLRTLVPMATRMGFQLGLELARTPVAAQRESITTTVVESFLREAQELLLEAAVNLALESLADLLGRDSVFGRIAGLSTDERSKALRATMRLHRGVVALAGRTLAQPGAWLEGLLDVIDAFDEVTQSGVLPDDVEQDVRQAAAMAWAAGTLVHRLLEWTADPARAAAALFDASLHPDGSPALAAHVRTRLDQPPTHVLTIVDLIEFLAGVDLLAELRAAAPEVAEALDWAQTALDSPGGDIVTRLLIDLAQPGADAATELLEALADGVALAVADEIRPRVLVPLREQEPDLAPFIDEIVLPLLVGVPRAVLPAIPQLGDEDAALRLREALSALLLQTCAGFLLTTTDILLERALRDGAQSLRDLAQEVRELDEEAPWLSGIVAAAARAVLPFTVTLEDIEALFELGADVLDKLEEVEREPVIDAMRSVVTLALDSDATREQTLDAIVASNGTPWPHGAQLEAAMWEVADGAKQTAMLVLPRVVQLVGLHYVREVKALAEAIYEGAKVVFEAAKWVVERLGALLAEAAAKIAELAQKVAALLAEALADIRALTNHLKNLAGQVVEDVRQAGGTIVEGLIAGLAEPIKNAVRALYNAAFEAVKWLITAPLSVLSSVAGWAESALRAGLERSSHDEQAIRDEVRQRILSAAAGDLHFDLKIETWGVTVVDLGRVTVPASVQLQSAARRTMDDAVFTTTVRTAAAKSVGAQEARAQQRVLEQYRSSTAAEQEASKAVLAMAPGAPITCTIEHPAERQVLGAETRVRVRIDGANLSFVQESLGVPKRATLNLNGQDVRYRVKDWKEVPGGIVFDARVLAQAPPPSQVQPFAPPPQRAVGAVRMDTGLVAHVDVADRVDVLRRVPAPEPEPLPEVEPQPLADSAAAQPVEHLATLDAAYLARGGADLSRMSELVERADGRLDAIASVHTGARTVAAPRLPQHAEFVTTPDGREALVGLFGLNVLQVAVSDGVQPGKGVPRMFSLGGTDVPPVVTDVEVAGVEFDPAGPDVASEHVILRNRTSSTVNLEGWTVRDLAQHVYTFGPRTLAAGAVVRLWTGPGTEDANNVHAGRRAAIWNNRGDSVIVRDRLGREVARHTYLRGAS